MHLQFFPHHDIHTAAGDGDLYEVKLQLQEDHRLLEAEDGGGNSPVVYAARYGQDHIVCYLLEKHADVNHVGRYNTTAVYAAAAEGHGDCVARLLAAGADVTIRGGMGCTPLMASSYGGHAKVVELLLNSGVLLKAQWAQGALQMACMYNHAEVVRLLLAVGLDPYAPNGLEGISPLDKAMMQGNQLCIDVIQDWERSYSLFKGRKLRDDALGMRTWAATVDAMTRGRARQKRVEAAPAYLARRMVGGEELPAVDVTDVLDSVAEGAPGEVVEGELGCGRDRRITQAGVVRFLVERTPLEVFEELSATAGP